MFAQLTIAILASCLEIGFGYPAFIYQRIGHPVGLVAWAIERLEPRFNKADAPAASRRLGGVLTVAILVIASLVLGLDGALAARLPFGILITIILAATLLAHRSLYTHVKDVAKDLHFSLHQGRAAVSQIVGRDVGKLDHAGVARAAIESLAENFSDGVVAPLFWLVVLGLPGCLIYKAVNTADSLIGHLNDRYRDYGWAAAKLDDLINLPASRLAALWLILAALVTPEASAREAAITVWRDGSKHRSPNAGWPEAAMAGALGLALGGPRYYEGVLVDEPTLGDGTALAHEQDIDRALELYRNACAIQIGFYFLVWVLMLRLL